MTAKYAGPPYVIDDNVLKTDFGLNDIECSLVRRLLGNELDSSPEDSIGMLRVVAKDLISIRGKQNVRKKKVKISKEMWEYLR